MGKSRAGGCLRVAGILVSFLILAGVFHFQFGLGWNIHDLERRIAERLPVGSGPDDVDWFLGAFLEETDGAEEVRTQHVGGPIERSLLEKSGLDPSEVATEVRYEIEGGTLKLPFWSHRLRVCFYFDHAGKLIGHASRHYTVSF